MEIFLINFIGITLSIILFKITDKVIDNNSLNGVWLNLLIVFSSSIASLTMMIFLITIALLKIKLGVW